MSENVKYNRLPEYFGTKCKRCGRAYPEVIINIEAVLFKVLSNYYCVNTKGCIKTAKDKKLREQFFNSFK